MHFSVILLLPVILSVAYAVPIGNSSAEVQPQPIEVVKPEEVVPKEGQIDGIAVDNGSGAEVIPIVVIEKESPASGEVGGDAGSVSSGETTTLPPQADSG